MSTRSTKEPRFRVGDRVMFEFGVTQVCGTVVEDRGAIGVGGRRLYRVRFQFEPDEDPMHIELGVSELTLASPEQLSAYAAKHPDL